VEDGEVPRPAFDPDIPEETARRLSEHERLLRRVRDGWTPHPFYPTRIPLFGAMAVTLLIVVSTFILAITAAGGGGLHADDFASALVFGLTFSGGFFGIAATVELLPNLPEVKLSRDLRYLAERRDGFVLPSDLDERTRPLLLRAQRAADAVLSSEIAKHGMLDTTLNAVRLREETWQIARRLAELARLTADYEAIVGDTAVPGELAHPYRPFEETLRSTLTALTARVEALEDYAEKVRRADRHFEVYRAMERLREHHPRFERLRAEIAADEAVGTGTGELGSEVEQVELRLRESIDEARQAAGYLLDTARTPTPILPPAPAPQRDQAPATRAEHRPDAPGGGGPEDAPAQR
jgi:hypothetical protein